MANILKYLPPCLLAMFLILSCAKHEGGDDVPCPIEFGVAYGAEVKGSELTSDNISGFGVFAAMEPDGKGFNDSDASLEVFMDNVPVGKTASGWVASPAHYWPILPEKNLSFFAYAPYVAGLDAVAGWEEDGGDAKTVTVNWTLDSNPANHMDLCVARAVLDRKQDDDGDGVPDPVGFDFVHTLSSVSFAANYIGDLPDGCYLRIDELSVGKLVNSNTLYYNSGDSDFFAWKEITPETLREGSYFLSIGGLTLDSTRPLNKRSDDADAVVYTDFVTPDGLIYALPQDVNPEGAAGTSKIDVTFSYVKRSDDAVIAQFYTSQNLPPTKLEASRKYRYQFTLDITTASLVNISCVDGGAWITDWEHSGNTHGDTLIK